MDPRTSTAVAFGGICGATLRWGIVQVSGQSGSWPTGVFVANIVGCALLGFVVGRWAASLGSTVVVGFTVGFCGALTTFSSFAVDLAIFLDGSRWGIFASYLMASFAAGFLVFVAGLRLGRGSSLTAGT